MSSIARRTCFALVLVMVLLATGTWQTDQVALAAGLPDAPLYPGLRWSDPVTATQEIRINIQGDTVSLPGERYEALAPLPSDLLQNVLAYYSGAQLAGSGWESHDSFNTPNGIHFVFSHESGVYLSVEFQTCAEVGSGTCLAVWMSEQSQQPAETVPSTASGPDAVTTATFGKIAPTNGATGLDPSNTRLSWGSMAGADKYKYCYKIGDDCDKLEDDWMSTYDRSITLTGLASNATYYWQVKATTCETCVPKDWVYADDDHPWNFRTRASGNQVTILGNAGVAGAVISYTDGIARTVTANSTGAYSLAVPYNWSGTLTPSKAGYVFTPASASFTNLTASQTIQNFIATAAYVISGNTGLPGVTLSYVNGTPRTVVSDSSGNYSFPVLAGWSGTVTPSKIGYVFSPANRSYSNVSANQTAQNYTPSVANFTISGNAGTVGVTLRYVRNGTQQSVVSDASGNYVITVPYNWSGTVTPSKNGYIFSPVNRVYSNVTANQTAQSYTATPLYTISGNAGAAGVVLSYTYGGPRTVTALTDGSYSFIVPGGWTGSVTPAHPCFTFSPSARDYTNLSSSLPNQNFGASLKAGCTDVSVLVGGANQGHFGLASQASTRANFAGVNNGPARIANSNTSPLVASERVIYKVNGINTSYSEMMGMPDGQVDTTYWLPWYNNVDLDSQLRIANVSGSQATVRLYIHGNEMTSGCTPSSSPFTLAAGASLRVSCAGVNNGPVQIESTQNIVAAARVFYRVNGVNTSYTETMALPNSQVDTTYWLPWYNNVDLDSQLRLANLNTSQQATVYVSVAGQNVNGSPFILQPGESSRVYLGAVNNGLVKIESDENIVASERVIYKVNGINTSYTEMMALPNSQVDTTHWLPWYNNVDLDTQLRVANVSGSSATVHVFVGTEEVTPVAGITLPVGGSQRLSYPNENGGTVRIVSNQPIVVSERIIYKINGVNTSYSEMMALPDLQLDNLYWLPWYNNVDLDTQLRFGRP